MQSAAARRGAARRERSSRQLEGPANFRIVLKVVESPPEEELTRLKEEVAALQTENELLRSLLDSLPDGIIVVNSSFQTVFMNDAIKRVLNSWPKDKPEAWQAQYGLFHADKVTPFAPEDIPGYRAAKGEQVEDIEVMMLSPEMAEPIWYRCSTWPLRDQEGQVWAGILLVHDTTKSKKLEEDLALRTAALKVSEDAKVSLEGQFQITLRDLSTPILEVWSGVLAVPVIGSMDAQRSVEMMDRLLHEVSRTGTRCVILDLTGIDTIDTETANHFLKVSQSVKLLGATCVLTGISPAIAQTMVALGADLSIATLRNLKHGLEYCLRQLRAERGAVHGPTLGV